MRVLLFKIMVPGVIGGVISGLSVWGLVELYYYFFPYVVIHYEPYQSIFMR